MRLSATHCGLSSPLLIHLCGIDTSLMKATGTSSLRREGGKCYQVPFIKMLPCICAHPQLIALLSLRFAPAGASHGVSTVKICIVNRSHGGVLRLRPSTFFRFGARKALPGEHNAAAEGCRLGRLDHGLGDALIALPRQSYLRGSRLWPRRLGDRPPPRQGGQRLGETGVPVKKLIGLVPRKTGF